MNNSFEDAVTPEKVFLQRRQFLKQAAGMGLLLTSPLSLYGSSARKDWNINVEEITDENKVRNYNNYYEFSTNKQAVAALAKDFVMEPWSLSIGGLVKQPLEVSVDALAPVEEYVYRFRCVEGWSMVVPWLGIPLAKVLQRVSILPTAKYVQFETVFRPDEMIGQRRDTMPWPYTEGLRLDEALHPLTILATGMYGKSLPPQNGGPVRLIVPWKYGFKSIKAIDKITLVRDQPQTTWNQLAPGEYGFYANVNPAVSHPRWSQRREVRLGEFKKIRTLPFNGYEDQVKGLYDNMDLSKFY